MYFMHASEMKSPEDKILGRVAVAALPFKLLHQHPQFLLPRVRVPIAVRSEYSLRWIVWRVNTEIHVVLVVLLSCSGGIRNLGATLCVPCDP
jgi:hypothetical protein